MTGTNRKKRLFSLVLLEHRLWGIILLPYILSDEAGNGYYRLAEPLSPYPDANTLSTLTPEERETVRIINEYSDRNLYKLFSKDRSVKEFTEKVTRENTDNFIRPYIERRLYKCLSIARDEGIPVCYRRIKAATIHKEDWMTISDENAEPVFRFNRKEGQTTYNLSLDVDRKNVDLLNNSVDILTSSPCVIREESRIIFVSDIDGSKIRPFLTKENIIIPAKTEQQYFRSFVLNAVNNYKVTGTGFVIKEVEDPAREAFLELGYDLSGKGTILLSFCYEGKKTDSGDQNPHFTLFERQGDQYVFRRYHRNFKWEKRCRDILADLGFFSEDDIHFYPLYPESQSRDINAFLEYVNRNYEDLIKEGFRISNCLDTNYNLRPVEIEMHSELINDWFDLRAIVKIGEWKIPFSRFRKNILDNRREFQLPDGSIAILPEAWFSRYRNIFELGKINEDKLRIHKQHFSLLTGATGEEAPVASRLGKLLVPEQISEINPPSGLKCTLRKYQHEGLNWLIFLQLSGLGGCLADDKIGRASCRERV